MKKRQILPIVMMLLTFTVACHKVEVIELGSNPILPLKEGNRWTYVDTIIANSTLPSIDTIIAEQSFEVTGKTYIDIRQRTNGKDESKRIHGWEISSTETARYPTAVFVIGDTLFTSVNGNYLLDSFPYCKGISSNYPPLNRLINSRTAAIAPMIVYPEQNNSTYGMNPSFHRPSSCDSRYQIIACEPDFNFRIDLPTLNFQTGKIAVTTETGTFDCLNYGSQLWIEDVGMIRSVYTDSTTFVSTDGNTQNATIEWRRTLKSYKLN